MNRFGKRVLALALTLVLLVMPGLPAAEAADETIIIEYIMSYNGELIDYGETFPRMLTGSWDETLHLPLRALAEAMGAKVGYDKGLVSVTYNGTTLSFDIFGDMSVGTVTNADGTVPYTIEPMPMVIDGRTLIAAETLEDVFGMLVSWYWSFGSRSYNAEYQEALDELTQLYLLDVIDWKNYMPLREKLYEDLFTGYVWNRDCFISVIDLPGLLDGIDDRFTVMNELLSAYARAMDNDIALTGNITGQADIVLSDWDRYYFKTNSEFSLPFEIDFELLSSGADSAGEMRVTLGQGFLDYLRMMLKAEGLGNDKESLMILEALSDLNLSYILNAGEGLLFFQSPFFSLLEEVGENAWFMQPFYQTDNAEIPLTVSQLLERNIRAEAGSYYGVTYWEITRMIAEMEAFFSDEHFTVSDSEEALVYTLELSQENNSLDLDEWQAENEKWLTELYEYFRELYEMDYDEYLDYMYESSSYDVPEYHVTAVFTVDKDGTLHTSIDLRYSMEDYWETYDLTLSLESSFPGQISLTLTFRMFDSYDDSETVFTLTCDMTAELFDGDLPSAPPEGAEIYDLFGDLIREATD
ncbi:MAG: copper amine oxidase N-terminal domain-containing protein [Oscillospiraceae bacterium]|nr:copper amine oxidase N-terminal domain-containing protein [Oscillospiraceae bacterium]